MSRATNAPVTPTQFGYKVVGTATKRVRNGRRHQSAKYSTHDRNRDFCPRCGKPKFRFETRKQAEQYLAYNCEAILQENGYAPVRAYYCHTCGCWHVTSMPYTGKEPSDATATRHEMRKIKQRVAHLEHLLNQTFRALRYGDLSRAETLCNDCLSRYEECLSGPMRGRMQQLFVRLKYCIGLLAEKRAALLANLFRVNLPLPRLFCRQWYYF